MWAIYKRELRSYFITPIGYIFAGMFIAVSGALFAYTTLLKQDSSGLYTYFVLLLLVFCILLPLLTMKLFAEERKSRTEQMLLTAPVTLTGIVCAKFFAALTIFAVSLAVNSLNFILMYRYGSPNLAVILTNILPFRADRKPAHRRSFLHCDHRGTAASQSACAENSLRMASRRRPLVLGG